MGKYQCQQCGNWIRGDSDWMLLHEINGERGMLWLCPYCNTYFFEKIK